MKMPVILITLFLMFCTTAFADIIYLNDGTWFEGEVIGFEGNSVRIKTLGNDIFKVDRDKIKKIKTDKKEDEHIDEEYPIGPGAPQWDSNWE
ncbi:MAG: hypothetical protein Q8R48_02945 [Candidatus Omnitrophota bacterium]|nr:hypothetical protein [Candidatus Omnitrophota bacterium]